uniref:Protein TIC 214 n=1 Tax=Lupinus princei TaxID=53239 RepID=A0A3S6H9X2_LUPPR|nr:Ycf1 [Lupinus princei]
MFFQPFILDNLVSLCMKIMNSLVVVGLYYGFLTTLSIGPSYLFLLRARAIEEGTEKKVSATTGFIAGQLMMFISIYYAPLHLALGRPYTITVIALPYLLFQLFCKNHKHFLNYGYKYKNPNSIRNLRIPRIFFNNLIFQLLNPLFLPSSVLVRLGTIYMFRWNNKLLFLISSFVGWLIGHIFLMKLIGLILVWIKEKNWIRSKKYIMSELKISMSQTFIVFLFITCLYSLGRAPSAFFIKNKKLSEIKERNAIDKKKTVERTSETSGTKRRKQGQKISDKEYIFTQKEKEKEILRFQKPLVTILFDYKRWNRPFRYIKNNQLENVVRNEISQFFFFICQSDRKETLFFTYPPNLSTFLKIMKKKISLLTKEKTACHKLSNYWSFPNEEKKKTLMSNEFLNRAKFLDKEFFTLDIVEKRIRLCNAETKKKYLPKIYDPFLNGPCRGRIKKSFSCSVKSQVKNKVENELKNETSPKNDIWKNKIHVIVRNSNYPEFGPQIDTFYIKPLLTEIRFFLNLINKFSVKLVSSLNFDALYLFREHKSVKRDLEEKKRKIELLFDTIRIDPNNKTIVNKKKCIGIKEISKKVPRWSYKLIDELQQLEGKNQAESYGIRSRKAKRVVIFTNKPEKDDTSNDIRDADNRDKKKELALIRYSQQTDFRRDIIKGSIRAQRRKILSLKLFQINVYSPLFLDKFEKSPFFSLDIFEQMNFFFLFKNWIRKKTEFKISDYTEKRTKKSEKQEEDKKKKNAKEEQRRIEIAEAWDNIIFAQTIRGLLLLTQSILRKYIILPSLIITKNIVRVLLFKFPEWSEDFRDWSREMYIKCTYNGVQLSEIEFPQKWLTDGIQIKILFPFRLKPWHRSKQGSPENQKDKNPMKKKKQDFCFLTISGMEVELPFSGYPRNRLSFFDPFFLKKKKKKKKKVNFFFFIVLRVLNERTKLFLNVSKDTVKGIVKSILKSILKSFVFLNEKKKELHNYLFGLKKKYELSESSKDVRINKNNSIIFESPILIKSINLTHSSSLTEKKIKNLNAKTKTIRKKIKKEKKKGILTSKITISSNKTTSNAKRLKLQKNSWQILQRRNAQLKLKLHFFFFMKGVYIDIFLCIISIPRIILELFRESDKKKSIYNNKANAEGADKTSQSILQLIKIINKYSNIRTTNSKNYLSSLSQAYVFLKLSQTQVINVCKYNLRSGFEYHRRVFFLKNEVKDSFFTVNGIFHSKLRHRNPPDFVMNQWINWLKGRSQYDLSENRWFRLVPQKWKNRIRINELHMAKNKDLTKCDSYEKNRSIPYKKQQVNSLTNKIKKQYGYDLLSYKSINYVDKKCAHVYRYKRPFRANKKQTISYNYKTRKQKLFDITGDRDITNYIAEDYIIDMKENIDRKFFDWIEMNVEIQKSFISNLESLLFSKFLIFYNTYMNNPWIIPIQLLLLNFNANKNVSENKNITEKKKIIDTFRLSKKKKSLEFELDTKNQAKEKYADRVEPESSLSNQEKDIEDDSAESDKTKRGIKKKKYKNKIEKAPNLLLRKYLSFQLSWRGSFNQRILNNVKVYCLLIRLINLKKIAIASIQRGELSLDLMLIKNQKDLTLTELRKNRKERLIRKAILIVEPVRLFIKNDQQFIMYQTIGFSLIHKSKRQINKSCPEKDRIDKKTFDKAIPRDQKITENKEKKNYDLLVPENILSPRRRRELRILISFNPGNQKRVYRKTKFSNENKVNKCYRVLVKNKDLDRKKKKLKNLKLFLWPIFRLEDLCCTNRYSFNTNNGSRFSLLRIHMYPRLKIR